MKPTFYDKKTCGTCKKAKAWLEEQGVAFEIVNIISEPPTREMLERFIEEDNVKSYLNSRSAIYRDRKLGTNLPTKAQAIDMMLEDPNLIKRPFIIKGAAGSFGFQQDEFEEKWI